MRRALHIAALVIIALLAIGLYKAKTDAAQARANVEHLQSQIAEAQADVRALRAQIAQLESPERVQALAQQRLHMQPGAQSAALPERAIDQRLPAPQRPQTGSH